MTTLHTTVSRSRSVDIPCVRLQNYPSEPESIIALQYNEDNAVYIILFLIKNIQAPYRSWDVRLFYRSKAESLSCVPLMNRRPVPPKGTGNSGPESPGKSVSSPCCWFRSGTLTPSRDSLWLDCCGTVWLVCSSWTPLPGLTFSHVAYWPTLGRDRKWDQETGSETYYPRALWWRAVLSCKEIQLSLTSIICVL